MKHRNPKFSFQACAAVTLMLTAANLTPLSASADTGQWQYSANGTDKWQYLNTSAIGVNDVHIADFNGDGKDDVFRGNGSNWYISYGGRGGWTRTVASAYKVGNLRFGDFNGDGKTDVFRSSGGKWYVSYSATSGWSQFNTSNISISNLAVGDFDGNGRADVFYGDGNSWRISYNGTGGWQSVNGSAYKTGSLAFADFNGDGKTDVFRATGSAWYVSYSATGGWTEVNSSSYRVGDLRFGDMNGDRKADVFRANGSSWYISSGATSGWTRINGSSATTSQVKIGDFDGDNRGDVFYPGGAKLFRLSAKRHSTVSGFGNAQADSLFAAGENVIKWRDSPSDVACRAEIARSGSVSTFSTGSGFLSSSSKLSDVFDVSGNVKLVSAVNYCGNKYSVSIVGCGKMSELNQIMEVSFALGADRGPLHAHELGHNVGLSHRSTTDGSSVMHPSLGSNALILNLNECVKYRNY